MARGFSATFGVGASDVVATTAYANPGITVSYSIWLWIHGAGGASFGQAFAQNWSLSGDQLALFGGTSTMYFQSKFTSTPGQFTWTCPSLNRWHHVCVSYNASTLTNKPTVYVDGSAVNVTTAQIPVGSRVAGTQIMEIGNSAADSNATTWDGMLAEFAEWNNSVLTTAEAGSLSRGISPLVIRPAALTIYLPIFGTQTSEPDWGPSHLIQTVTGTKAQNHAPVSMWQQSSPMTAPPGSPPPIPPIPTNDPFGLLVEETGQTMVWM